MLWGNGGKEDDESDGTEGVPEDGEFVDPAQDLDWKQAQQPLHHQDGCTSNFLSFQYQLAETGFAAKSEYRLLTSSIEKVSAAPSLLCCA